MNGQQNNGTQRIVLSREELLFVLRQLNAETLPGLEADPLGTLTPAGERLAQSVAEQALRARGLVRHDDADPAAIHIHRTLLTLIGGCLHAQQAIFLYAHRRGQQSPLRYFGHLRGDEVVVHTHPERALHQFTLLPNRDALFTEIQTICLCPEHSPFDGEFTVPFTLFEAIQRGADSNERSAAQRLLTEANVATTTANAFLDLLATDYLLSIFQVVNQQTDGTIAQREMVLFHDDHIAWLAFAAQQSDGQTEMYIRTVNREELTELWSAWI